MMLGLTVRVSSSLSVHPAFSVGWRRLLQTTNSCRADAKGTSAGSAGSQGAAPGRAAGKDEDVKFGDTESSPSSGELYGREDRDPLPSPNPGITQASSAEMSFPRDQPGFGGTAATDGSGAAVTKEEGVKQPEAYPIQNDPSVPEGAGPELSPQKADELRQDESSGPKAAGQGVVEDLAKEDPERYGSGRSSPA